MDRKTPGARPRAHRRASLPLRAAAALLITGLLALPGSRASLADDHVLLIGGLGGEEHYRLEFLQSLAETRRLLTGRHGYVSERVRLLADGSPTSGPIDASPTLANVQREFARLAGAMKTSDTLLLVLVGHGQSDFQQPKFNLPGPDLSADRLKALLDRLPARDQRLILAFPCSGHFSRILSDPLRTILASSDGARQIYHSAMANFLVQALRAPAVADENADGDLSFDELFRFVSQEVEGYYLAGDMIQTENPSLDDNGDGEVTTMAEGMDAGDGENAGRMRLTPAPSAPGRGQGGSR